MEKILSRDNMNAAYKRVCANKGAGGVDGVTVEELGDYIKENWGSIREQIRRREYKPQPVRRVEIPKPNGGVRKLGIPIVMDRVIQQGVVQVISPMCEPLFSEWSYGFRPNRSCEMAIRQLLVYLNEGYEWIVDIDLEKFFDNVPQDKLMSLVHDIINDGDTESLIRKYLKAGVMTPQGYEETRLGTPQGGNLSLLLSNIMLNELDKGFEASAKRVMRTITDWIQKRLGLKVNMTKTHITRPTKLKYLGFSFYKDCKTSEWRCRPHKDSVARFKKKLKELTSRKIPGKITDKIQRINQVTRGWINYYALGSMKKTMTEIDAHLRTRIRIIIWKQWKVPSKRQWGLQKLGINKDNARRTAYWGDRYVVVATRSCLNRALSKEVLEKAGLISCLDYYSVRHALKLC